MVKNLFNKLNPVHCRVVHKKHLSHYPLPAGPRNTWRYRYCGKCYCYRYLIRDRIFGVYGLKTRFRKLRIAE